jgi:hypothetical protein
LGWKRLAAAIQTNQREIVMKHAIFLVAIMIAMLGWLWLVVACAAYAVSFLMS